jgi:hypothetical protein
LAFFGIAADYTAMLMELIHHRRAIQDSCDPLNFLSGEKNRRFLLVSGPFPAFLDASR